MFIPLLEKENSENLKIDDINIYEEYPGEISPYSFMANNISEKKIGTDIKNIDVLNLIKSNFEELNYKTELEKKEIEADIISADLKEKEAAKKLVDIYIKK